MGAVRGREGVAATGWVEGIGLYEVGSSRGIAVVAAGGAGRRGFSVSTRSFA